MKRFLTRILLLVALPLLMFSLLYEFLARKVPNVYSYKNEWLSTNAKSVKILNLGSSHGYFGIDPTVFSTTAFNAAHESQDLKYDHFIFMRFIQDMDSLRVLVLPISYGSLLGNGLENSGECWRAKNYCIYYHCNYHRFQLYYNSEFYNDIYHGDLHFWKLVVSTFGSIPNCNCDEFGKGIRNVFEERENEWWEENGRIRAIYHTKPIDTMAVKINKKYVQQMIDECANKGITVLLVTTPTYKTYRDNMDGKQLQIMLDCCQCFQRNNNNVIYLNLLSDKRFHTIDFSDSDHLNEYGAKKLTGVLQQTIDSLGIFKN